MKKADAVNNWKKSIILGENKGSIKLEDLARGMNLESEAAVIFLKQIFPFDTGLKIYQKDSEYWVDFQNKDVEYMLPLSPGEWIYLHQLLSKQNEECEAGLKLKQKLQEEGPIKIVMELLNQIELWDREFSGFNQEILKKLELAIADKHLLHLTTNENKTWSLSPCKILHLEGSLTLIAEDAEDHCLLVVPIKKIKNFDIIESDHLIKVSAFEIEEFITAIRSMGEKETRLILKIHDPQSINLFPDYHFLGKPCMITNPAGDLIWAAYVEPCESLYDWLTTLGNKVEILDPISFKEEYLTYCEEKLRKVA